MTPVFDETVRPRFARLATPIGRLLAARGVPPSAISWAGFSLGLAAAGVIVLGHPWLGVAVWLASRVADGLDGVLAREARRTSPFGGYLDITLDMTAYCAMVVAFSIRHPEHALLWTCVLTGYAVVITTTLALAAAAERAHQSLAPGNRTFQFTRGLAEAGETTAVYVLWALFPRAIGAIGWLWCAMLAATAVQRTWLAWRHLPGADDAGS